MTTADSGGGGGAALADPLYLWQPQTVGEEEGRHSLTLLNVTEEDFGEYSCEASNEEGAALAKIRLTGMCFRLFCFLYLLVGDVLFYIESFDWRVQKN